MAAELSKPAGIAPPNVGKPGFGEKENLSFNLPAGFKQRSFTTSDGVQLAFYDNGVRAPSSKTIVMVPGWTMPGAIWFDQAQRFGGQGFRVIVMDPRGQGASSVPTEGYLYKRRAADIAELLASCCDEPVVLIGWSLGGLEALQYAADAQYAKLSALVLVDHSVGTGDPPRAMDPMLFTKLRANQKSAMSGFVRGMFTKPHSKIWLDQLINATLSVSAEDSIRLLSQATPREFWRDTFLQATVPTLYAVTPRFAQQSQLMKAAKPSVTTEIFDGAGHALFIDEPVLFHAVVSNFLRTIK